MKDFKPMLSATVEDTSKLAYPLLASPKLDGIRALVRGGVLVSRNLKPIPNKHSQKLFALKIFEGLDGELIVGEPGSKDAFRATSSGVMSHDGEPDVRFYVFDCSSDPALPFTRRLKLAQDLIEGYERCLDVAHVLVHDEQELLKAEQDALAFGYEGIMLRHPDGAYKYGRGTLKAQDLMKLKRFADAEAVVLGVEEQMHNTNEAKADELGRTKRSSHKSGMVGKGVLGALMVKGLNGPYKGKVFNIGTGFDDAQRQALWKQKLDGQVVKYKYFPTGSKDAPRFPVFLGFRHEGDRS